MRKVSIFLLLVVLTGCHTVTEPTIGGSTKNLWQVFGTVTDATNHGALDSVSLMMLVPDTLRATTSSSGSYKFETVPPGKYTLEGLRRGYESVSAAVEVDSGANTRTDIAMQRDSGTTEPMKLTIQVTDASSGAAIAAENVHIYNDPPAYTLVAEGKTDDAGNYVYTPTTPGWYYATIDDTNYYFDVDSVLVTAGSQEAIQLRLQYHPAPSQINYDDSLIASYRFSNSFVDSSGHSHDGTRHGVSFTSDRFGRPNSALSLNGTSDYISIPDSPDLNFGRTGNFTVTMWLNCDFNSPTSNTNYLFYKGKLVSNLFTGYDGFVSQYQIGLRLGTTYGDNSGANFTPSANLWHLVAFAFDRSGNLEMSIDGGGYGVANSPHMDGNCDVALPLYIGGNSLVNGFYKGKMDDVRIFHGIPSSEYLTKLFHEYGF